LIENHDFKEMYTLASDSEKNTAVTAIIAKNRNKLMDWIKSKKELEEFSVRELKKVAYRLSISSYSVLSRERLIDAIRRKTCSEKPC